MPGGPRGARRRPAIGCRTPPLHRQVASSSLSSGFLPQYNDRCCHAASLSDEPEFDGETWRQYITDNHDEPDRQSGHQWRRCLSCIFGLFITERYCFNRMTMMKKALNSCRLPSTSSYSPSVLLMAVSGTGFSLNQVLAGGVVASPPATRSRARPKDESMSSGSGNTIVVFFSVPISISVCR